MAHGLMHMVISNAVAGDPYHVDVLFYVHGQHGVEFLDEYTRCDGDVN